jgi:hypothetical protein
MSLVWLAVSMRLVISPVEDGDDQAVASLYRWLSRDAAVAACGQVRVESIGPQPGEMGSVLDVITAVFSDAGAAAGVGSLLVAYRAWRDTRTRAPSLTIEKDGVTLVVNEGSEEEVRRTLGLFFPGLDVKGPAEATGDDPGEN